MEKIKLDLFHKSVAEKLDTARVIAPQLIADADVQVQAAGNALNAKNAELRLKDTDRAQKEDDAMQATRVLKAAEAEWDDSMRAAAAKVTEIYPNDPAKWVGIGFEVSNSASSTGVPAKIENLTVSFSEQSGDVDLHWDRVANAKSYKIQITEGDPTVESNWKFATPDSCTKSQVTVTELASGKAIWFRVAGFNASGQGVWCNPVNRVIP